MPEGSRIYNPIALIGETPKRRAVSYLIRREEAGRAVDLLLANQDNLFRAKQEEKVIRQLSPNQRDFMEMAYREY